MSEQIPEQEPQDSQDVIVDPEIVTYEEKTLSPGDFIRTDAELQATDKFSARDVENL